MDGIRAKPPIRYVPRALAGWIMLSLCLAAGPLILFYSALIALAQESKEESARDSASDAGNAAATLPDASPSAINAELKALVDKVYPAFVIIGGGSGVCISPDGYMLTNHHVADAVVRRYSGKGPISYPVHMAGSGKPYIAHAVGGDSRGDIVMLKIQLPPDERLPFIELAPEDSVKVGDLAVVIGNPHLLAGVTYEPSVSAGVIAAAGLNWGGYSDCFQVDAAANPGNSGGPVFNIHGHISGIVGRIRTRHGQRYNTGAGFCIEATQLRRFAKEFREAPAAFIRHGIVSGLRMVHDHRLDGCEVAATNGGSQAFYAGLKKGDLITHIDHYPIRGVRNFYGKLCAYPLNSEVEFSIRRGDEFFKKKLVLDVPVIASQDPLWPHPTDDKENDFIFAGIPFQQDARVAARFAAGSPACTLGVETEQRRGNPSTIGIEVKGFVKDDRGDFTEAREKLKPGDVLTHFNDRRVRYLSDVRDCLTAFRAGEKARLRVLRDNQPVDVEISLGYKVA